MKSVNILGAGIAGMSAANFLAQSGLRLQYMRNVVLLAAPDGDYEGIENECHRKSYRFFKNRF